MSAVVDEAVHGGEGGERGEGEDPQVQLLADLDTVLDEVQGGGADLEAE
ncbi:hypothetical protein [Kitasatospora sp. NPDC091207]